MLVAKMEKSEPVAVPDLLSLIKIEACKRKVTLAELGRVVFRDKMILHRYMNRTQSFSAEAFLKLIKHWRIDKDVYLLRMWLRGFLAEKLGERQVDTFFKTTGWSCDVMEVMSQGDEETMEKLDQLLVLGVDVVTGQRRLCILRSLKDNVEVMFGDLASAAREIPSIVRCDIAWLLKRGYLKGGGAVAAVIKSNGLHTKHTGTRCMYELTDVGRQFLEYYDTL